MDFKLDVAKWRCGGFSPNQLGEGETSLRNTEGYMCCLGQFSQQLGCSTQKMFELGTPDELYNSYKKPKKELLDVFVIESFSRSLPHFRSSNLACRAMGINDNPTTTPKEKIEALATEFATYDHTITLVNEHLLEK